MIKKERKLDLRSEQGFTLMELIVVIGVIAILIAILLPQFNGYTDKANVVSAKSNAKTALTALSAYKTENDVANKTWSETEAKDAIGNALGAGNFAGLAAKKITIDVTTSTAPASITTTKGDLIIKTEILLAQGQLGKTDCSGNADRCDALVKSGAVDTKS